jgi:hypothetical protein
MVLGRIIVLTDGEAHSPIRVKWLTKVFVTGDVISFLAQSAGKTLLETHTSLPSPTSIKLTHHQEAEC